MLPRSYPRFLMAALCAVCVADSARVSACDCQARAVHQAQAVQVMAMPIPAFSGMVMAQPVMSGSVFADIWTPPGTPGETYERPSHPVPIDKHPRVGMLAVRDNGEAPLITVRDMGGFRMKNGIWLFESVRPLDPGACQIVRVESRTSVKDIEPTATKFVRLIPGRIVYLDF
jgi:hypothetical protein